MAAVIPLIEIEPLFGPASPRRDAADRAITAAAGASGVMTVVGFPPGMAIGLPARRELLRIFDAPREIIRGLSGNISDPSQPCVYRGWFAPRQDRASCYEAIAIGPDIAYGEAVLDPCDPLRAATPLPPEPALPGWRAAARTYYLDLVRVAAAIMDALARGLGVDEKTFAPSFASGLSTLRLMRYPARSAEALVRIAEEDLYVHSAGVRRMVIGEPHADYGFVTLLAQHGIAGLQARMPDGDWVDIPPSDEALVVNFGTLLERWSDRRIRATEHRVLSTGSERFSIPFFYEPRADARIAPLPGAEPFEPFLYGDHVWSANPRLRRLFGERRRTLAAPLDSH